VKAPHSVVLGMFASATGYLTTLWLMSQTSGCCACGPIVRGIETGVFVGIHVDEEPWPSGTATVHIDSDFLEVVYEDGSALTYAVELKEPPTSSQK